MSETGNGALIEVEGLTVDFFSGDGWTTVVNGVSFAMRPGESLGLVGESGCGKTTTALSLLGYRRPNSRTRAGHVRFRGRDLLALSIRELRRVRGGQIALVPQDPTTALTPGMRVGEQLAEAMRVHGVGRSRAERAERVLDLLEHVRLPAPARTARKYPHQLSGGQQQRVTIGMALACQPQLLVLDEPTTGLDVTTQAQILDLLARLRAELGMAMVYVTHNLGVVASICDRVGVMYAGELLEDAPTRDLFRNPRHPYTQGLIASVPSVSAPEKGRSVLLHGLLQRDLLPPGCPFAPRCDFARAQCRTDRQSLAPVATDHSVACWRWRDIPSLEGREAAGAGTVTSAPTIGVPQLKVANIDCAYEFVRRGLRRFPVSVVHDVSFDIKPRETFALVGESGSGKSTIARAVNGLLLPATGKITFDGKDITATVSKRSRELRREIQLVLQNPDASLNPRQRVRQIIGRPLELFYGPGRRDRRGRVEQLLDDVRLPAAFANRYPDELSGGERQRVAIARALAAQPKLMLCDEVLSALDVSVQADILDLLRTLQAEHEMAYLFISHDLAVVRSISHRVGVLYRGELCESGLVKEVYSPPSHPYTHMLLSAVPEVDVHTKLAPTVATEAKASAPPDRRTACPFAHRCPWKVGPICEDVAPPWREASDTHAIRCHIPLDELVDRTAPSPQSKQAVSNGQG